MKSLPVTNKSPSMVPYLCTLILIWVAITAFINPLGEFMVNDDWSFIRALETFVGEGRIGSTGWGPSDAPGGPALIFHLLWGTLFTAVAGHSCTVLRLSVLSLGVLASLGMLFLLRRCGDTPARSLLGTLTLVFNPLFLSHCFTYMTDVTFTAMALFAVQALSLAVDASDRRLLALGLFFSLCAVLTRQIGLVIPAALLIAVMAHPRSTGLSPWLILIMASALVVIPWGLYEYLLSQAGGTSIDHHQVVHNILRRATTRSPGAYANLLAESALVAIAYVSFMISPVLARTYPGLLRRRPTAALIGLLTGLFLLLEGAILFGFDVPQPIFHRNTIFDFGIGPILLKDTYILGLQRTATIPLMIYYAVIWWTVLSMVSLVSLIASTLRRLAAPRSLDMGPPRFTAVFCLTAGLLYLGIIVLSGFHDRYLIPVCMFFIVWVVSETSDRGDTGSGRPALIAALVPLLLIAAFSLEALRDFMELKRALTAAQRHLVVEKGVNPCSMDGGMEFNGYHCYRRDFQGRPGLSWWWVDREDYVLTLGPLPGYQVERTFPFRRVAGGLAAIHVLRPLTPPGTGDSPEETQR